MTVEERSDQVSVQLADYQARIARIARRIANAQQRGEQPSPRDVAELERVRSYVATLLDSRGMS